MRPTNKAWTIKPRPEKAPVLAQKRTKGEIVGGWFGEESFYRDITTRTLAIVISGSIAYVAAVVFGYVGPPPREALPAIISAVAMVVMASVIIVLRYRGHRRWSFVALIVFLVVPQLVITWAEPWFAQKPPRVWFYTPLTLAVVITFAITFIMRRRLKRRPLERRRGR